MKKRNAVLLGVLLTVVMLMQTLSLTAGAFTAWTKNDDGKYYNDEGEVIQGVTARGMDVSEYQGIIDWDKLYREEYLTGKLDFIILRCGYGDDDVTQDDKYFYRNADACTRLGIPFGVYLFSYADTLAHAYSEVDHVLRMVKNYTLSYPIYFDVEWSEGIGNKGGKYFADICDIFCGGLQKYGYEVGVYSFRSWFTNDDCLGAIDFEAKNYGVWIAEFGSHLNYYEPFDIWQCTSSGSCSGVSGRCDINYSYITRRTTDHCYLTFDLNTTESGLKEIKPMHVNRGSAYGLLPNAVGKKMVFDGWYTEKTGGTRVTDTTTVAVAGKQTLYAHWKELTYTVKFQLTGANVTAGGTEQTVQPGKAINTVTLTAAADSLLPDSVQMPAGLTYTKKSNTQATVSGTPAADCTVTIKATEKKRLPEPDASLFTVGAASAEKNADGTLTGVTEEMEISIAGGVWREVTAAEAKNGVSGLPAGSVSVRMKATAEKLESYAVELKVLFREEKPDASAFTVTPPMIIGAPGAVLGLNGIYEYSKDNGTTWTTIYNDRVDGVDDWSFLLIRKRATENSLASEPAILTVCTFHPENALDYTNCSLNGFGPDSDFIVDGEKVTSDADGRITIKDSWFGKTVKVSADEKAAVSFDIAIPGRPAAPSVSFTNETLRRKSDGTITGLTTDMEYSTNKKQWLRVTSKIAKDGLTELDPGTYYVRYRGVTSGSDLRFPSDPQNIEIDIGRKILVTFKAEGSADTVVELSYEGIVREIPVLPARDDCVMEESRWDIDITGQKITEDTEIHAVYVLTEAAKTQQWIAGHLALLIAGGVGLLALVAAAIAVPLILKKKKKTEAAAEKPEKAPEEVKTDDPASLAAEEKTVAAEAEKLVEDAEKSSDADKETTKK